MNSAIETPNSALLKASDLGMRFFDHYLFREIDIEVSSGESLLVTGPNGSGKSTLLRILAGQLTPTKGSLSLTVNKQAVDLYRYYLHLAWTGPYFELYPDLTLAETVRLHFDFKKCLLENSSAVISMLKFEGHESKLLRNFSSGMLQRLKTGLALFTAAPLLLLDEPTSNMDAENAAYMRDLIGRYSQDRILVMASNEVEGGFGDGRKWSEVKIG